MVVSHASVEQHYGSPDIAQRVIAAASGSQAPGQRLRAEQLFPFDQLHGREIQATRDHAARLSPDPGDHLLDMGSGIGGPARYFATTFGCRVTGLDLTPQFVEAAKTLTEACDLQDRVHFQQGDLATMPFEDRAFDHAYCFYVGMNLPDRPAVLAETFRVLKPGGRLLWTEAVALSADPHFPLPWARTPEASHVISEKDLCSAIETAGFEIIDIFDETEAQLELARHNKAHPSPPDAVNRQANEMVLGADFPQRCANYMRSLAEHRLSSVVILASKPL